ncbi:hypothetical protein AAG570_008097 [Ranatra chinensis]|uniref:SAP30-binding protein n=1 Tax=Ranatra chinensis TaxID=642074 RepID=A0ABD0YCC2_9HEMI
MALASLTENYTDSEGEEHPIIYSPNFDKPHTEKIAPLPPVVTSTNGSSHLVSYLDDTLLSDEEYTPPPGPEPPGTPSGTNLEPDVELPPEPTGRCSNELQEKIARLHDEMMIKGLDMNKMIQKRKDFRNPSIYEKLIQFCRINEFGTNYSPDVYDPLQWGKSSFYDELAKSQKAEMDQREKERREKTKVLIGTAKKSNIGSSSTLNDEDAKRRKSKWDQTSTATGTKGTVISAFGSLPKKQRV